MIPKINAQGYSFKGVTEYLMHDKESDTSERVAWTQTGNIYTEDVFKAAKVMAWTDIRADQLKMEVGGSLAGRKRETGSVYHYSLAWALDESPEEEHQREVSLATLKHLGLSENQYYMVGHNDTKHTHVHIVVNLTHPETGKRTDPHLDKRAIQAWALEYEREHGLYCKQREENARLRGEGIPTKHQDQKQDYSTKITRAYYASDTGKAFKNALELEGLQLANGNRNTWVVVDQKGKINRLMRSLDIEERGSAKTKAVLKKLGDLDRDTLPDANELSNQIKNPPKPFDSEKAEVEQQKKFADAADKAGREKVQLEDAQAKLKDEAARVRQQKAQRIAKDEKSRKWQRYFDERITKAREKHDIDGTKERFEQAQEQYKKYQNVKSRLFQQKKFEDAYDNLQNREKQLANQMNRFKADIMAIMKNRKWAIAEELEKQGFDNDVIDEFKAEHASEQQQKKELEDQLKQLKKEREEREALEKTNLEQSASGQTQKEKDDIARLKRLTEEFIAKREAQQLEKNEQHFHEEKDKVKKTELDKEQQAKLAAAREKELKEAEKVEKELGDRTVDHSIQMDFEQVEPIRQNKTEEERIKAELEADENKEDWEKYHDYERLDDQPEFENEEARRIWIEQREAKQNLDFEQDQDDEPRLER